MRLACFYHVWAGGRWREPMREHLAALRTAGVPPADHLGIVGPELERDHARRTWMEERSPQRAVEADAGFEQVTLEMVRAYAQDHGGAVLYAHTKGAADTSEFRARWRRAMTWRVVTNWRHNLDVLDGHGLDAIGCHWLTAEQYPGMVTTPFFGGNFWIATCAYLRTLPPVPLDSRFSAETWIGLGNPRVGNLLVGWPHECLWPEQTS